MDSARLFDRRRVRGKTFDLDPLALYREVETPFAYFGIKPVLFDAPFRDHRRNLTWEAEAFLCVVPDAVMSRTVHHVVGFRWGFALHDGALSLRDAAPLDDAAWSAHVALLATSYPTWTFDTARPAAAGGRSAEVQAFERRRRFDVRQAHHAEGVDEPEQTGQDRDEHGHLQ